MNCCWFVGTRVWALIVAPVSSVPPCRQGTGSDIDTRVAASRKSVGHSTSQTTQTATKRRRNGSLKVRLRVSSDKCGQVWTLGRIVRVLKMCSINGSVSHTLSSHKSGNSHASLLLLRCAAAGIIPEHILARRHGGRLYGFTGAARQCPSLGCPVCLVLLNRWHAATECGRQSVNQVGLR